MKANRKVFISIAIVGLVLGLCFFFYKKSRHGEDEVYVYYKVFQIGENRWGYDIYIDNKRFIHQDKIPAVSGNQAFKTEQDAAKMAQFVLEKLKTMEYPTVTVKELKGLNIVP